MPVGGDYGSTSSEIENNDCGSESDDTNGVSVEDVIYGINAFWETLKPVAITVIIASLACNYIIFYDETTQADKESGMEIYTAGNSLCIIRLSISLVFVQIT